MSELLYKQPARSIRIAPEHSRFHDTQPLFIFLSDRPAFRTVEDRWADDSAAVCILADTSVVTPPSYERSPTVRGFLPYAMSLSKSYKKKSGEARSRLLCAHSMTRLLPVQELGEFSSTQKSNNVQITHSTESDETGNEKNVSTDGRKRMSENVQLEELSRKKRKKLRQTLMAREGQSTAPEEIAIGHAMGEESCFPGKELFRNPFYIRLPMHDHTGVKSL
ncbi:hypothetical protein D918_07895 [Trichuris suis]|nr:hypothetical protein D918_07895 [Trichuris suis]